MPLDAGDFSLMDRKVVDAINSLDERDRFIRGMRSWVGFKQIGVKYTRPERLFGKSTNNVLKNIRWAKKGIFSFSFVPLEAISYISYFFFFVSLQRAQKVSQYTLPGFKSCQIPRRRSLQNIMAIAPEFERKSKNNLPPPVLLVLESSPLFLALRIDNTHYNLDEQIPALINNKKLRAAYVHL